MDFRNTKRWTVMLNASVHLFVSRQQYVCLLERVPRQLKGLHAASLAERALNHILTQEVVCFKTCIQHLNT